jgi:16S rRNA (guanine966-N2)-methyltransferase
VREKELQIEQGFLKGKKIQGQKSGLRPTTSKVRAALFNILRYKLKAKSFVDCFAGTGLVGFEALSLGASRIGFVELNKMAVKFLYKNTAAFGIEDKVSIKNQNVYDFLQSQYEQWDILFFSPPYDIIHWYQLIRSIEYSPIFKEGTLVILQHPSHIQVHPALVKKIETRQYGFNCLTFLEK